MLNRRRGQRLIGDPMPLSFTHNFSAQVNALAESQRLLRPARNTTLYKGVNALANAGPTPY